MQVIEGKIVPLNNNVLVSHMDFDEQVTKSGIVILSDDGKTHGIKPRWGKVWAIGPDQNQVSVGEWILVEHGRWTRGIKVRDTNGTELIVRRVDTDAIMLQADSKPDDVYIGEELGITPTQTVRPEEFSN